MMRPAELRRPPVAKRGKGQVREGLRYVRTVPDLWIPLVMMAIIGTLSFNFQVVLPLFATRTFGGDDDTFTLLLSVISVGSLTGALVTARRKTIELRHVVRGRGGVRRVDARARRVAHARAGLPDRAWSWASSASPS